MSEVFLITANGLWKTCLTRNLGQSPTWVCPAP